MQEQPLIWMRAPQQARSQATLDRLLDAAESLLDEGTFDQLSVQAICKRASSSVGAFYTRFADKTALLHVLHERLCAEAKSTAAAALAPERWVGVETEQIIGLMVRFLVAEYGQRRGLRRELVRRNGIDLAFRDRSIEVAADTVQRLSVLLAERQAEIGEHDPLLAAEMCNRLLFGVLDQHAQYADVGPAGIVIDDETLIDNLKAVLLGWLRSKPAPTV
ncbi:MAG TPA: TetR/AcrR family transcriptional regulator [Myxococcota bacterium]